MSAQWRDVKDPFGVPMIKLLALHFSDSGRVHELNRGLLWLIGIIYRPEDIVDPDLANSVIQGQVVLDTTRGHDKVALKVFRQGQSGLWRPPHLLGAVVHERD